MPSFDTQHTNSNSLIHCTNCKYKFMILINNACKNLFEKKKNTPVYKTP